jgi:hypothetical protein
MNQNRFGLMLDDKTSAKLFALAKKNKQEPYHYLNKLINDNFDKLLGDSLLWDGDYE